jgi:hypothetical protein
MNRGDVWAIVSVAIAVILGIPALPYFLTPGAKNLSLVITLGILLLVVIGLSILVFTRPAYTILVNRSILTMLAPHGEKSTIKKILTLYPNNKGQQFYTYRNFSSSGSKKPEFRVDDWCIDSTVKPSGGDLSITVKFPYQLKFLKAVSTWLEVDYYDSFPDNPDYLVVQIDQPTHKVEVEVRFNSKRPSKAAAFRRTSAADVEEEQPTIENDTIRWSKKRTLRHLPNGEYHVMWWW